MNRAQIKARFQETGNLVQMGEVSLEGFCWLFYKDKSRLQLLKYIYIYMTMHFTIMCGVLVNDLKCLHSEIFLFILFAIQ